MPATAGADHGISEKLVSMEVWDIFPNALSPQDTAISEKLVSMEACDMCYPFQLSVFQMISEKLVSMEAVFKSMTLNDLTVLAFQKN